MLQLFSKLAGFRVLASAVKIGHASDFFFDDEQWTVDYLGTRISSSFGTTSLVVPVYFLDDVELEHESISLLLSLLQIRRSAAATFKPSIERQNAAQRSRVSKRIRSADDPALTQGSAEIAHLHSCRYIAGRYRLHAAQANIGTVEDFLIGTDEWSLRYLVIRLEKVSPGKLLLFPTSDVCRICHARGELMVDFPGTLVAQAPKFTPGMCVDPAYESQVRRHYEDGSPEAGSCRIHARM